MKLFALLALIASACSPPPPSDVQEIRQGLQTVFPPWYHASYVYVGGLAFSSMSGVLYMDVSAGFPGPCQWVNLSNVDGQIGQDTTVYGSAFNDFMQHIRSDTTITCTNGSYHLLPMLVSVPSIKVDLFGAEGNDTIYCGGSNTAGWSFNTCYGYSGNDWIALFDGNNIGRGGDGNDSIWQYAPASIGYGEAGDDCLTWSGSTHGVTDCGLGSDKAKVLSGTVNCEAAASGNGSCGWF